MLLSLIVFDQRYSFRRLPLLLVHLLSTSFLIFVLANILDIFYYPQFEPNSEGLLNLKIAISSAIFATMLLGAFFYNPVFGKRAKYYASGIMLLGSFLFGITLTSVYSSVDDYLFFTIIIQDGEWLIDFKPLYLILLLGQMTFISFTIFRAVYALNSYPVTLPANRYFEITSIIAILCIGIALIVDETISTPVGITGFVLGLVFLVLGVFFLFYNILRHPLSSIYLRNISDALFEYDIIGFVLYSNTDIGPEIMFQSNSIRAKESIKPDEIFKFGVTTLMTAYNDNRYIENVSLTPFAAREDYFALSITFVCKDNSLQDKRFKDRTQSALVLLIPTDILVIFSQPLRNIYKIQEKIIEFELNDMQIQDLANAEILIQMSKEVVNTVF